MVLAQGRVGDNVAGLAAVGHGVGAHLHVHVNHRCHRLDAGNIDFVELREGMLNYLPIGAVIGLIVLVELALAVGSWVISPASLQARAAPLPEGGRSGQWR